MELALAMGRPVAELESTVTEREFGLWRLFDRQRILPERRTELHLAQIAMSIAAAAGVKNLKLDNFLFKPEKKVPLTVASFGFKPRPKRRKDANDR